MSRKWLLVLAVLALFTVFSCQRQTQTTGTTASLTDRTIVVATDATWPPMEYTDESAQIVGFDVDLIRAIAQAAGFQVEVRNQAWDGIFAGVENESYDAIISSVTINDERRQTYDFSEPYLNAGQVLVLRSDTTGITRLADMVGRAVGAQIGTTGAMEIEKVSGVELRNYDEIGLAFEDLVNERIDGVVCDTPIAANFVLMSPTYADRLVIAGTPFTEENYGIVVRKGNTELVNLLNNGLEQVIADGTRERLIEQWLR